MRQRRHHLAEELRDDPAGQLENTSLGLHSNGVVPAGGWVCLPEMVCFFGGYWWWALVSGWAPWLVGISERVKFFV